MDLRYEPFNLTLSMPFTIARGTQTTAGNVRVELSDGAQTGIGEAAPSEHYGEMQATVCAFLEHLRPALVEGNPPISVLHEIMDATAHLNPAAKAAVPRLKQMMDEELNDEIAASARRALKQIDPSAVPATE